MQKTIKAGDQILNTLLKQNLNITLGQLSSIAIDAPKEAIRRSVCFAPNIMRLARSQMAKQNRQELKRRVHNFFEDSGMFGIYY